MVDDTRTTPTTRHASTYHHGHFDAYAEPTEAKRKVNPMSVAALVLGVIGFIVPIIPSALALAFGYPARKRIAADPQLRGDGMALTGIILGWVALGLYAFAIFFIQFSGL